MLTNLTGSQNRTEVESNQTLQAIKEFKRFLEKLEKDVSRSAGKSRKKEISESARFVVDGIHEAENYLAIVKKVIEKTDRILHNKALHSANKPSSSIEKSGATLRQAPIVR